MAARLALGAALLAACGGGDPVPARDFGAQIFADPRLSENPDTVYSCATCHAVTAEPDPARIYPGHTLYGVARRPSWWGGFVTELLPAVNFCYESFLAGPGPLEADDPKAKALYEYLASLGGDEPAPARPLTFTRYVVSIPPGDPGRGEQVYAAACATCHGDLATGAGALADVPPVLSALDAVAKKFSSVPASLLLIERVRHGQFWGLGGSSPPFSLEALPDADLAALLGYIGR